MDKYSAHIVAVDQALEKERQQLLNRHSQSQQDRAVAALDTEMMLRLQQVM